MIQRAPCPTYTCPTDRPSLLTPLANLLHDSPLLQVVLLGGEDVEGADQGREGGGKKEQRRHGSPTHEGLTKPRSERG